MKSQSGSLLIVVSVIIFVIAIGTAVYYLGKSSKTLEPTSQTQAQLEESPVDINVKTEAGDIVVTKDGENKKITDWGYNSAPILSPDKSKVAYLSKTEESLENEKKKKGYVPGSTNVWIINNDGSDPIKVTTHGDWIYRDNLVWLDNSRLLFTDGTSSVKVYDLKNKSLKNILGPEIPNGICVDACGGESRFLFSPDKKYLVHLSASGSPSGIFLPYPNKILNTQTLISEEMNQKFSNINYLSADFEGDSLFIEASENPTTDLINYNINLKTGEASHL